MTLRVSGTDVVKTDRSFVLGTATPGSPVTGMIRWSTTNARFEVYDGSAWVAILTVATATPPLWGWGTGARVGDNTGSDRSSPVSVVGGFTDWVQVSAGSSHAVAIRADGTAWAWGSNSFGYLGDGTTTTRLSPVGVIGGITNWSQISGGGNHTAAIRTDGTAWAWGYNGRGQIGDGTIVNKSSPVSVIGGITNWIQIAAGAAHTVGLRSNGTVWGWGRNNDGRLGDNTTSNRSSPVSVVGGFTDWVQVSAGINFNAAIRSNGTAWCWGGGSYGRLGNAATTNRSSPVSVVGGFTDWVQVSAGARVLGVRANGTAWGWGENNGAIGDNTITNRSSPVSVVRGFTDWVQVSTGSGHSLGIRASGYALAWGTGSFGQLGTGNTINRSSPVDVAGFLTDWVQVSAGGYFSVGLRAV